MINPILSANETWINAVLDVTNVNGFTRVVKPRGLPCREMHGPYTVAVNPYYPIVSFVDRKLNYKFAAAEALWITTGRNDLEFLTAVNRNMAKYSDDGKSLTGAYGPKIFEQIDYVVDSLVTDEDTRQASLTIWERNPAPSKDVPCTVAMSFYLRNRRLSCAVFMRSSDIYLGLPYDIFSFSMVMRLVLERYVSKALKNGAGYLLGPLYITAGSSHLYDHDLEKVAWVNERAEESAIHENVHNRFFNITTYTVAAEYLHRMMAGDYV